MRRTLASLIPWARAMLRVLQCVASGGVECNVASITARTFSSLILGMRPGRGASFSNPLRRKARKRWRQSWTVGRETSSLLAMSWLSIPLEAIWMIFARRTTRRGIVLLRAHWSKIASSSGESMIRAAFLLIMPDHIA